MELFYISSVSSCLRVRCIKAGILGNWVVFVSKKNSWILLKFVSIQIVQYMGTIEFMQACNSPVILSGFFGRSQMEVTLKHTKAKAYGLNTSCYNLKYSHS